MGVPRAVCRCGRRREMGHPECSGCTWERQQRASRPDLFCECGDRIERKMLDLGSEHCEDCLRYVLGNEVAA